MAKETTARRGARAQGRVMLIGLGLVLCLSGCKTKPDPATDPHQTTTNPLTGVWHDEAGGVYYFFREDGTGGKAADPNASPDDYSFLYWRGQGLGVAASKGVNHLVTIGGDTSSAAGAAVKRYTVTETSGDSIVLTPKGESSIALTRASGAGTPLSLNNLFLGEWHALWNGVHGNENTWSFKFREDGTVRTYHHGMHQFDNAYLVRDNVMALLGEWRFDGNFDLKYMMFEVETDGGGITAREESADGAPGLNWDFRRVDAAEWK